MLNKQRTPQRNVGTLGVGLVLVSVLALAAACGEPTRANPPAVTAPQPVVTSAPVQLQTGRLKPKGQNTNGASTTTGTSSGGANSSGTTDSGTSGATGGNGTAGTGQTGVTASSAQGANQNSSTTSR